MAIFVKNYCGTAISEIRCDMMIFAKELAICQYLLRKLQYKDIWRFWLKKETNRYSNIGRNFRDMTKPRPPIGALLGWWSVDRAVWKKSLNRWREYLWIWHERRATITHPAPTPPLPSTEISNFCQMNQPKSPKGPFKMTVSSPSPELDNVNTVKIEIFMILNTVYNSGRLIYPNNVKFSEYFNFLCLLSITPTFFQIFWCIQSIVVHIKFL